MALSLDTERPAVLFIKTRDGDTTKKMPAGWDSNDVGVFYSAARHTVFVPWSSVYTIAQKLESDG